MLEISILKIQDPGCFWGRIVKGAGLKVQSPQEYENLHVKMNLFYHDVNLDVQKVRPPSVAERQVCVVYSPTLKSWCRAVVESIYLGTVGCQVMCFLVDHAEHILVSSDSIRAPLEKFLQLPFWAKKFQLAGICPMRLQVPVYQEKAKLVPSTHWDSSATRYLHSLAQASSLLEAVLCEVLEDVTAIELYITIRNVKICVNDDLVTKKFACFASSKSGSSPYSCLDDPSPAMLTCDIFSNGNAFMTHNGCATRPLCSGISPRDDLQNGSPEASQAAGVGLGRGTQVPPGGAPEPEPLSPETAETGAQAICVNDDLVTKKFACFSSNKSGSSPHSCLDNPSPAMLTCDIFSNANAFMTHNGCATRPLCSGISPRDDLQNGSPEASQTAAVGLGRGTQVPPGGTPEPEPLSPETAETGAQACCAVGGSDGGVSRRASDCSQESMAGDFSSDGCQVDGSHHAVETETQTSLADDLLNKLNLFRFMKFLNPFSKSKMAHPEPDSEEKTEVEKTEADSAKNEPEDDAEAQEISAAAQREGISAAPPPGQVRAASALVEEEEEEATTFREQQALEEELDCARLLQLLNPDPLNSDVECLDSTTGTDSLCQNIRFEPSKNGILLHSAIDIDPCTSLAHSPITDNIRKHLVRKGYGKPRVAEWYCWPAVARGCDTLLISGFGAEPLTYVPPLLSHLHLVSACGNLTSRTGPIAVILCHGWEKAQCVFDLLEDTPPAQSLHPMIVLVGEKDEAKGVKIQRNCHLLVTTPFSLARLLEFHRFIFLRLCHLVLDEVDVLFSKAPEEMAVALQYFQKAAASEERAFCTKQIIAVGRQWSRQVEGLVKEHMSNPSIIITVMEEAALYGGVHQMVLMCLDCTKVSVLLGTLDFVPDVAQKTLIITNTVEEVDHVFQAVNKTAAFCMMVHEGLTYQFDFVIEQWRKPIGPGTHVILVMTNECLKALGIRDATCVVHYGFPSSPRLFGTRLCCMSQNFQNLSDKDCEKPSHPAQSVLLLSERDAGHVIGVLRYLERSDATLPPELQLFAQGVLRAKEGQKAGGRPLCGSLKSFGFCRDSRLCPDRHLIDPKQDAPRHPDSGNIVVLPLYIKNASCYYGRIVSRKGGSYESLAAEMTEYYASEKFNAKDVVEGDIYGIQEEDVYRRVQVLVAPDRGERLFCSVRVHFLDEGREQEVKAHQLLKLPDRLHSLPPQAVEIIVCRAKPIDGEVDWNPKVNRCISQKIKGVEHHAKIVLSLGNTIWVDPMVRITRLPGLKTSINEYNVRSEILATGMGTSNPQHLELLRALCPDASVSAAPGEPAPDVQPAAPAEILESLLSSPAEVLECPPNGPAEALECPPNSPAEALEGRLSSPADALEGQLISLAEALRGRLSSPAEALECPLSSPVEALEGRLSSLAEALEGRLSSPAEALEGRLSSPAEALEGRESSPAEALANGMEACTDDLQSGRGEPGDPPERESGIPAPPPEGGPQAALGVSESGVGLRHSLMLFPGLGASVPNGPRAVSGALKSKLGTPAAPQENGVQENGLNPGSSCGAPPVGCPAEEEELPQTTRFHPQIKWYERDDSVMLNIKLLNPTEQKCQFFSDRVVFSARLNDRHYYADLRLSASIVADASSWEVRSNEPVLRLIKQRPGTWNVLLRQRSPFVTFDFDHFEEGEPAVENIASEMGNLPVGDKGLCFVEQTGEEWCYVRSDSESDSD